MYYIEDVDRKPTIGRLHTTNDNATVYIYDSVNNGTTSISLHELILLKKVGVEILDAEFKNPNSKKDSHDSESLFFTKPSYGRIDITLHGNTKKSALYSMRFGFKIIVTSKDKLVFFGAVPEQLYSIDLDGIKFMDVMLLAISNQSRAPIEIICDKDLQFMNYKESPIWFFGLNTSITLNMSRMTKERKKNAIAHIISYANKYNYKISGVSVEDAFCGINSVAEEKSLFCFLDLIGDTTVDFSELTLENIKSHFSIDLISKLTEYVDRYIEFNKDKFIEELKDFNLLALEPKTKFAIQSIIVSARDIDDSSFFSLLYVVVMFDSFHKSSFTNVYMSFCLFNNRLELFKEFIQLLTGNSLDEYNKVALEERKLLFIESEYTEKEN